MSGYVGVERGGGTANTAWHGVMLVVTAVLGAVVLVALIVTLANANHRRDEAISLQSHSFEVMILSRTLSGTIAKAEASLGRYVISGDQSLGSRYADSWALAGSQIDRLDAVTDAQSQQTIDALRTAYRERGRELALTALATTYHRNGQALARYYAARRAPALARIDTLLDQIIERERVLLKQRTSAAMQSVTTSNRLAGILAVFGILIVLGAIALGWLVVQAIGQRTLADAEADAERARAEDLSIAVAAATAELREQEARLRQVQKMEAVGQLTGGIAHDFNNMLAVIVGGLELARRHLPIDPARAERQLDRAMEGADRATALTRRLLAFSREQALSADTFGAGELVQGMKDLLDRTLGDAVTITVRDDAADWQVRVDRHQLENVLLNLAVNARDAMNERGTLTIATGPTVLAPQQIGTCPGGDYVAIAVSDTGCGMAPEVIERVFEPFFTTKPVGKGTGLGLSQAFAFAKTACGEIAISSAPGAGTTVTIYLPRHGGSTSAAATIADAVAARLDRTDDGYDILVVEDDPRVLVATVGALEELGHRPLACSDPLTAPALLAQHGMVDLIVSDVLMPYQTGPEMVAALPPSHAGVAVLFVTGYAGDVAGSGDFGGWPVLRKPFTLAALERAVADAIAACPVPDSLAAE